MVEMIRIISNCDDVGITATHFDLFWRMHRLDPKYEDIKVQRAKLAKDERVLIEYSLHGRRWRREVLCDESPEYELPPSARIQFLARADGMQKVRLRVEPLKPSDPEPVLSEQGVVEFVQLFIAYLRDEGFEVQEPKGPVLSEDEEGKKPIFVSYRRADSAGHAGRLYDRLSERFGEGQIFMDVATIESGLDFPRVVEEAASSCDVLIAIIGKQWLTITDAATGQRRLDDPEDLVCLEIAMALDRNIRVIPVLVGGATMPPKTDLPVALERLARRNALKISDEHFRDDVDRLIETLEKVLGVPESPPPTPEIEIREHP